MSDQENNPQGESWWTGRKAEFTDADTDDQHGEILQLKARREKKRLVEILDEIQTRYGNLEETGNHR